MIFERKVTKDFAFTKIQLFTLPMQIVILLISSFLVALTVSINHSLANLEDQQGPRRIRKDKSLVISSHVDYQLKKAVVEDIKKMYEETLLERSDVHEILKKGKKLLSRIDTIYDIKMPKIELEEDAEASKKGITIVGDIHGGLPNMIHLFKVNGFPSLDRPYIFNGDFTDRQEQGLECLLSLLLIKIYCNECLHMHLGNHETQHYYHQTLKTEVIKKYDLETYKLVREVLLQLPLGAVIDHPRVFVIHAGLPKKDFVLDDLRHYKRGADYDQTNAEGMTFGRAVWTDPVEDEEKAKWDEEKSNETIGDEEEEEEEDEEANAAEYFKLDPENDDDRGWYTQDHTETFLMKHSLDYIVRGHSNPIAGFQYNHGRKVITVNSDPEEAEHRGAYLNIYSNDGSMNIEQFSGVQYSSINRAPKLDWRSL